jgi:hypothetical protein
MPEIQVELQQEVIAKLDDRRLIFLWMSVAKKDGAVVIDKQGDELAESELEEAVYAFMEETRTAKVNHAGPAVGKHIAGLVFTTELQKLLGVEMDRVGWLSVVKVDDDEAWRRVKAGELRMGSLAGHAIREVT